MKRKKKNNITAEKKERENIKKKDSVENEGKESDIEKRNEEKNTIYGFALRMQYYAHKMDHEQNKTEYYEQFRNLFYEKLENPAEENDLDREEKFKNFSILANYCHQKFNENFKKFNEYFINELSLVYRKMIEHEAYSESENDYFHLETYRNVVKVSVSLADYDWLSDFHEKCTSLLHPVYQNEMSCLTDSYILFHKKRFLESLERIDGLDINFALSKIDLRNQKLKLYFEMYSFDEENSNETESLPDSNHKYLMEADEISGANKELYKLFLDYHSMLLKIKSDASYPMKKENIEQSKVQFNIEKKIVEIKELLEKKVENLINSYNRFLNETNEISESNKELYRSFLKYYSQVFKIKSDPFYPRPAAALGFINKKLNEESKMIQKKWLLEKIDAMLSIL